jgi:hypothetical protein
VLVVLGILWYRRKKKAENQEEEAELETVSGKSDFSITVHRDWNQNNRLRFQIQPKSQTLKF